MFTVNVDTIRHISQVYRTDKKQMMQVIYVIDNVLYELKSMKGMEDEIIRLKKLRARAEQLMRTLERFAVTTEEIANTYDNTEKNVSQLFSILNFLHLIAQFKFIYPLKMLKFKFYY